MFVHCNGLFYFVEEVIDIDIKGKMIKSFKFKSIGYFMSMYWYSVSSLISEIMSLYLTH